jgi:hypothetical protein
VVDKVANIFGLMIIGGIIIRVITNANSKATLGAVFNGFANDVSASLGK